MAERRLPAGGEEMIAIVISSAHLTGETAQYLGLHGLPDNGLVAMTYDYGWVLWSGSEDDEYFTAQTEDIQRVLRYAQEHGYDWVRLDQDGPEMEGLPSFEW